MYWDAYIALKINEEDKYNILKETKSMVERYKWDIAWHNPEYLHMTILYLGWINDRINAKKIVGIIEELNGNTYIRKMVEGSLLRLGWEKQQQYLTVRLNDSGYFKKLNKHLKLSLEKNNIRYKEQEFIPHITVGRIRNDEVVNENNKNSIKLSVSFSGLALFESVDMSREIK